MRKWQEPFDRQIEKIMQNFDFDRVHRHMVATDWKWRHNGAELHVPSIARLRKSARARLDDVVNHPYCPSSISCGGFKASKLLCDSGEVVLKLEFVVAKATARGRLS